MARRVYADPNDIETLVLVSVAAHEDERNLADAEFLLIPAADAERVRTLILLMGESADATEALKLLEVK